MSNRLKSMNYIALKGTLLKSKEIRNSLNFAEASKQKGRTKTMAKITYTNINGYLIPNLIYKSNEQMEQLGRYGILRKNYLKKHKNSLYQSMLLQGTLEKHLLETDKAAREREKLILKQLEKQYSLPDKESDYVAWIRAVNQQKAIAEEIILKELIYI